MLYGISAQGLIPEINREEKSQACSIHVFKKDSLFHMIQQQDQPHRHLVSLVCLPCFRLLKHLQQSMRKSRFVQRQQRRGHSQYRAILSGQVTRGCGLWNIHLRQY